MRLGEFAIASPADVCGYRLVREEGGGGGFVATSCPCSESGGAIPGNLRSGFCGGGCCFLKSFVCSGCFRGGEWG